MKKDLIQLAQNMALESLGKDSAISRQLQDLGSMIPQIPISKEGKVMAVP